MIKDNYESDIQKFMAVLQKIGFPEIHTLAGRYFTFNYSCPVYGKIMLSGRVENVAYRISQTFRGKKRSGAFISFRVSTNVIENFGMRPNEDKSEVNWQHGMHTLEFSTGYGYRKGIVRAGWSFVKQM
jgi:hypothetical protein